VVRNKSQQLQEEGRKSRTAAIACLASALTSPDNPIDGEQIQECRSALFYFEQDAKKLLDTICRRYSEPRERELLRTILLGITLDCVNRLLAD
jgi:hypothetical protein